MDKELSLIIGTFEVRQSYNFKLIYEWFEESEKAKTIKRFKECNTELSYYLGKMNGILQQTKEDLEKLRELKLRESNMGTTPHG